MNTFLKTFFICAILAFGFLGYKYLSVDSYSANLTVSKNNPVFGTHEGLDEKKDKKEEKKPINKKEEFVHKCYFYSNSGNLYLAERKLSFRPSLENSIKILLKGPLVSETKKGVYSEIPSGVDLISIKREENKIVIDLTSNFGNGGGSKSITNRVEQLSKTIKLYEPNKNIYLYIDGKEVEYLGGDGVYIKQPLE